MMTGVTSQVWREEIQAYTAACRERTPVAARETLSAEDECRCRHIGGSFYAWIEQEIPQILQLRASFQRTIPFENAPLIVLTTEMPGLVSVHEFLRLPSPEIVCLLDDEYRQWDAADTDPQYLQHLHYWSYFRVAGEAEKASLAGNGKPADDLRLHVIGCLCGEKMGIETTHLWQWNGGELVLLQEGYQQVQF